MLLKLDKYGDSLWSRFLGPEDARSSEGRWLCPTRDGNWVAACVVHYDPQVRLIYLLKLDSLGNTLWTRVFGSRAADVYWPGEVCEVKDDGFVVTGQAANDTMCFVYLAKTDSAGRVAGVIDRAEPPARIASLAVSPNPCSRPATVRYQVGSAGAVDLAVYDNIGRRVRTLVDGNQPQGCREVAWNRDDDARRRLPEGVYFLRLEAPGVRQTRKVVLTE